MHIHRKILLTGAALLMPLASIAIVGLNAGTASAANGPPVVCSGFGGTVAFASPGLDLNGTLLEKSSANPTFTGYKTTNTDITGTTIGDCSVNGGPSLPATSISLNKSAISGKTTKCTGTALPDATGIFSADPEIPACLPKSAHHVLPKVTYYGYDSWTSFEAGGGNTLGKAHLDITINLGNSEGSIIFDGKDANEVLGADYVGAGPVPGGGCNVGEVGFQLTGKVTTHAYKDNAATLLACLGGDAGTMTTGSFGSDFLSPNPNVIVTKTFIDGSASHADW